MQLTQQHIKHLKTLAHSLKPVVRVGQHGVTAAVIRELDIALAHHELVKVKISIGDRTERADAIDTLCNKSQSQCIQKIGGVAVLFRRNADKAVIKL